MAKRKLNSLMRSKLNEYALEAVIPANEAKAIQEAYDKAAPMVRTIVEKKFPPDDIKICAKYGVVDEDDCIQLQMPNGVHEQFEFEKDFPKIVNGGNCSTRVYLADETTANAVEAWVDARDAFKSEKKKRLNAYRALINGSVYLEDVCEVWPQAAEICPPENALLALGPEQIEWIKADLKEREAA